MIDVWKTYKEPMKEKKLFAWHQMLLGENKYVASRKLNLTGSCPHKPRGDWASD